MKWIKRSDVNYVSDNTNFRYIVQYVCQFWYPHVVIFNKSSWFLDKDSRKSLAYGRDDIRFSTKEEAQQVCERHYKLLVLQ